MLQSQDVANLVAADPAIEHAGLVDHHVPAGAQWRDPIGAADLFGVETADQTGVRPGHVERDAATQFVEERPVVAPRHPREDLRVDLDRVDHWVSVGAQMSDRVRGLVVEARKQSVDEEPTVTTE